LALPPAKSGGAAAVAEVGLLEGYRNREDGNKKKKQKSCEGEFAHGC
jgi:hypothetical protein